MCVDFALCAFICIHNVDVCQPLSVASFPFSSLAVNLASVRVDKESRESAVLILISSVDFSAIQLHANLIPDVQMQDHAVGCVVVVLISILCNGACSYLVKDMHTGS